MSYSEIMAPVGSWEALHAAIHAGADSIYFGLEALNMRSHSAHNFTIEDLSKIVEICLEHQVKSYVTMNSIIYDEDMELMRTLCRAIKQSGATAVIACDIAVLLYAKQIGLDVHISTQSNVCNYEAVRFYSTYSDVVVLARELSLEQIRFIYERIQEDNLCGPNGKRIQLELFVHGAFCISVSGKCHMSLLETNKSANRGACVQNCRRSYRVIDEQTNHELVLENHYVMSPKDLCTIEFLDQIIDAGITVLKIEGRGKAPEYVSTVVRIYREARDAILEGSYTPEKIDLWKKELASVYNRGFWDGYYLGKKVADWSGSPGSQASQTKTYAGKITRYFPKLQVAEALVESGDFKVGDEILIMGPQTGVVQSRIESLHAEGPVLEANKGMAVSFPVPARVRENDKVYLVQKKTTRLQVVS